MSVESGPTTYHLLATPPLVIINERPLRIKKGFISWNNLLVKIYF